MIGSTVSMNILAIETSCDESSLCLFSAVPRDSGTDFTVHKFITHSQIDVHREFGGVFPAMARREHQKNLVPLLLQTLEQKAVSKPMFRDDITELLTREPELLDQIQEFVIHLEKPVIDAICVTSGPGLEPALWVGINFAKALGRLWDIPVIPVNHMEGHILSVLAPNDQSQTFHITNDMLPFPAIAVLISGGHTELVLVDNIGSYTRIGKTRDDAVGEAFDKVARILGLPYPGGPEVSKLATQYAGQLLPKFPRPMVNSGDYDFSFSGLKTAVLYHVQKIENLTDQEKISIAYDFQESVTEVLVKKTLSAIQNLNIQTVIVAGGVSANSRIKEVMIENISTLIPVENIHFPVQKLTGDNALMIGLAGYYKIKNNPDIVYHDIRADGNLCL